MKKDNLGFVLEDIRGKFELVLEGHAVLHKEIKDTREQMDERFDMVDFKIETLSEELQQTKNDLNQKIDAVAADLKAHREDTEAHPGIYHVGEK